MRCIGLVFRNRYNECSSFFVEEPDNRDLSASYQEYIATTHTYIMASHLLGAAQLSSRVVGGAQ